MKTESVKMLQAGLVAPNGLWRDFEDWLKETTGMYIENLSWNDYAILSERYLKQRKEN